MSKIALGMRGLDDLLFENKNKSYGAYAIRRNYNERLAAGIAATAGLLLCMWLYLSVFHHNKVYLTVPDITGGGTVISPEITIIDDIHPKVCGSGKKGDLIPKFGKDTKQDTSKHTDVDGMEGISGAPQGLGRGIFKPGTLANINVKGGTITLNPIKKNKPKPFVFFDVEPKFKDGDEATFIRDHLNYPQIALDNGIEGTVTLSVVIDESGNMSSMDVLSKVPMGCTAEAIRVLKLMNGKWIPGKVNGEVVSGKKIFSIRFTIPK